MGFQLKFRNCVRQNFLLGKMLVDFCVQQIDDFVYERRLAFVTDGVLCVYCVFSNVTLNIIVVVTIMMPLFDFFKLVFSFN